MNRFFDRPANNHLHAVAARSIRCAIYFALLASHFGILASVSAGEARRIAEPLVKPAFTPLPPGAVEPAGWLRDWAVAAGNGITGHLDEWSPVYRDGWKGVRIEQPGLSADGTGWPLEQSSYWLDGLVRLGYVLHDDALIKKAADRLNLVVAGVNRGGKSFIYWKDNPPEGFNNWACSHMGRALVAWYAASGDRRILDALVRNYSEFPLPREEFKFDDVTGLCNIDAMLETYSYSGEKKVLDNVLAAVKSPGVDGTFRGWEERRYDPGHAVCAYEKLRLPLLLYPWTGEERYRQATLRSFDWVNGQNQLPYGVSSGMENLAGVGAFRLTETCTVVADLWSSLWRYRIEGDRACGDGIERLFFNAGPGPIARDFQTMCYYQSPNRIESETLPAEQPNAPGKGCLKYTQLAYPHVLCCVGAVNRLIPNYIIHMWMRTADGGLAASLYGPCKVTTTVGGKIPIQLTCRTAYPFEETIRVTVDPEEASAFPLYFRIPAWCSKATASVNGARQQAAIDAKGFLKLERKWSRDDVVELHFPMPIQIESGFETEYPSYYRQYFNFKPERDFEKQRLPYESVTCGPLLFALPIADIDPQTPKADARWQFALDANADDASDKAKIERKSPPAKWDWPFDAPIAIELPARTFDWHPTDIEPLPAQPVEGTAAETIRLIPYGCTKFRISMFPVTQKAWQAKPEN